VRWQVDMSGCFCKIESEEASWNSAKEYEHGNSGYRPAVKGGYFPTPPIDSFQDMRSEMCLILESLGIPVEVHHHEVAQAQMEIGTKFSSLVQRADWLQLQKYVIQNVAHSYGKTATFMPKPIVGDNGSACTCTSRCGRTARTCSPATAMRACRSSRCTTSAASLSTPGR
jgi:glutamine synthetase